MIGNCIGAQNVPLAKRLFKLISCVTEFVILLMAAMTFCFRDQIVACFTDDKELAQLTSQIIIIAAYLFPLDGTQGYLQGPIRALGL